MASPCVHDRLGYGKSRTSGLGGDHAIEGGAGDEIELAAVKSGTTIEEFACVPSNRAPTALLEIKTPDDCHRFFSGGLECEQSSPRITWTNAGQIPDDGAPTEIAHEYAVSSCSASLCVITLTVTDSAGQSHSDAIVMVFVDETPD